MCVPLYHGTCTIIGSASSGKIPFCRITLMECPFLGVIPSGSLYSLPQLTVYGPHPQIEVGRHVRSVVASYLIRHSSSLRRRPDPLGRGHIGVVAYASLAINRTARCGP
jgi:hypothetical protein